MSQSAGPPDYHLVLLSDENSRFLDFGFRYYDSHINLNRKMRNHVRKLQHLAYKVTLETAA